MGPSGGHRQRNVSLIRAHWYEIPFYWPYVERWVSAALEGRSIATRPDDVYLGCMARTMTLWLAVRVTPVACAVTEIVQQRRVRVCQLMAVGGQGMDDWMHFEADIRAYAKQEGCDAIEACGRRGWQRKTPDYKPVYMIYRRML